MPQTTILDRRWNPSSTTSARKGDNVSLESIAHGFRSGLPFLSLMMLIIGLVVAVLLARRPADCGRRPRRTTPHE